MLEPVGVGAKSDGDGLIKNRAMSLCMCLLHN